MDEYARFALAGREDDLAAGERCRERMRGQYQIEANVLAGRDRKHVPGGELCADALRIDHAAVAIDDEAMERVLHIRRGIRLTPQPIAIAFVFGEQELGRLAT